MVQTDIAQLSSECSEWRQILRNYKEEFQDCKKSLQTTCTKELSKDQMQEVEHFDNQFHIQLINIHDLKQDIKTHEKRLDSEASNQENIPDEIYTRHEDLLDQFLSLESTFQELRNDFRNFVNATSC
jgi:chromosome segregation ATPase